MNPAMNQEVMPEDGEALLWACDQRDPRTLGPGLVNDALNMRYTDGLPATRKGVVKPVWANYVTPTGKMQGLGQPYGLGTYRDPNSLEWQLRAAGGLAWYTRPGNLPQSIPLPTGVTMQSTVSFVQAFDRVFAFRGRFLAPLLLTTLDAGFQDLLPRFNSGATYNAVVVATGQAADEMAYGPYLAVSSLTRVNNTVTVVTTTEHGYVTGADIQITGATPGAYNARVSITVVDTTTFTFQISGAPATPGTGTIKCSNNAYYWKAQGSKVTLTTLTQSSGIATATKAAHGFSVGQYVTIAGSLIAGYNLTVPILTVPTADTFTFAVVAGTASPATGGTITATTSQVLAGQSPDTNPEAWARTYNILPNAATALFINDLLLVPTAFEPSSVDDYATISGGAYKKVDYLVATNYLDYLHFSFVNEFRINSGSSDEIVDLFKFGASTVIILKGSSWAVLSNVTLDLSQITLDIRSEEFGCVARGAWTQVGSTAYFLSSTGVVTIRQSDLGALLGVTVPLSTAIPRAVSQIDWRYASTFRMAQWDNKLYVAVAFTDGTKGLLVFDFISSVRLGNSVMETGVLVQGWTPLDTGAAFTVVEFCKNFLNGKERLFFLDADGCVNLLEEAENGDQLLDATTSTGTSWAEISQMVLSRAYGNSLSGQNRPVDETISLATWRPNYTVQVILAGVNNIVTVASSITRSNTTYDAPFDALPWNASNVNNDWNTPWRQDYSVTFDGAGSGMYLGSGVNLLQFQEAMDTRRIGMRASKSWQLKITNTQGRMKLVGQRVNNVKTRDQKGTEV